MVFASCLTTTLSLLVIKSNRDLLTAVMAYIVLSHQVMMTVGAAVHIHLEGTTQTRLVCGCVCVCMCVCGGGTSEGRSGIVYTCIRYSLKAKPCMQIISTVVLIVGLGRKQQKGPLWISPKTRYFEFIYLLPISFVTFV